MLCNSRTVADARWWLLPPPFPHCLCVVCKEGHSIYKRMSEWMRQLFSAAVFLWNVSLLRYSSAPEGDHCGKWTEPQMLYFCHSQTLFWLVTPRQSHCSDIRETKRFRQHQNPACNKTISQLYKRNGVMHYSLLVTIIDCYSPLLPGKQTSAVRKITKSGLSPVLGLNWAPAVNENILPDACLKCLGHFFVHP